MDIGQEYILMIGATIVGIRRIAFEGSPCEGIMRRLATACSTAVLMLLAAGCGSSSRQLQSITISPSTADAQSFPNGQVQFVASGHYNQAPMATSPLPVLWSVYLPGGQSGATINQNGLAQCQPGVTASFSILADAPADPSVPVAKIGTAKKVVLGLATLTCP